jgi:hypothetical protein
MTFKMTFQKLLFKMIAFHYGRHNENDTLKGYD